MYYLFISIYLAINIPVSYSYDHKYYYQNSGQQIEKDNEFDVKNHGIELEK